MIKQNIQLSMVKPIKVGFYNRSYIPYKSGIIYLGPRRFLVELSADYEFEVDVNYCRIGKAIITIRAPVDYEKLVDEILIRI